MSNGNEPLTAYQLACQIHQEHGLPVFPVLIRWDADNGKWNKKPLVKWSKVAGNPDDAVWQGANAIGVPTGLRSGLFVFDLDDYKLGSQASSWVEERCLPPTRTHQTASGGRHLIYRLPEDIDLGNHAPLVTGLDVRGNGGFIVWADVAGHYSVLDETAPVTLPDAVCSKLLALKTARSLRINDAAIPDYDLVSDAELDHKLGRLLNHPKGTILQNRLKGSVKGLTDKSASGRDMSVAALLAEREFSFDEIVQTLLMRFQHGVVARDGWDHRTERLAKRCAFRATEQRRLRMAQRKQAMEEKRAERSAKYSRLTFNEEGNGQ